MPIKTLEEYLKQTTPKTTEQQATKPKYRMIGFYKETEFQETSIGKIPKEWEIVKLKEILSLEYGKGLPKKNRKPGNIPVVGSNGVVGYHNRALVKGPGLVIGRKGTIGAVTFVDMDFWPIDTTYYVKLKRSNIYFKWLFYQLINLNLRRLYLADVVPGLKRELVYSFWTPLPPLEEQWGIAEILSSVDESIEATERFIGGLERLKRGLMQELLTKGIGHREYKQTPIGKIPKEWNITILSKVASINEKPINIKNVKGLVARIPMELIPDDSIYARYELVDFNNVKSYVVAKAGDILLAKITPSFENGKQGIVPEDVPNGVAFATTEVYPITPRQINRMFLFYLLKWKRYRKLLEYKMTGTTGRRRVPRKALENLLIPLPSLEEQKHIATVLSTIDKWIESEKKRREKFERLKRGLMNVLLTGRVRVRVASGSSG